jgi:hypothetical protein
MRAGVLYFIFVVITLWVASSVQTGKIQVSNDSSTCQPTISDKIADCLVPAANPSLKKHFTAAIFYRPVSEKPTGNYNNTSPKLNTTWLKYFNEKVVRFKPVRQTQFHAELYFATEKDDHQHLF